MKGSSWLGSSMAYRKPRSCRDSSMWMELRIQYAFHPSAVCPVTFWMVSTLSAMKALFLIARELVRVLPRSAMCRSLVPTAYDFLGKIGKVLHRIPDHERAELDPVLVHEVEDAGIPS